MSFNSRSGSRRNEGVKVQKSVNQRKAAAKLGKRGAKYLNAESVEFTLQMVVEKTLVSIERLGNQIFALSPFSQYYDDWLINLRHVVSEFEAFPDVAVDGFFVRDCEQAFLDIQSALADNRVQESAVLEAEKALYELNAELRSVEVDYAEKSRMLNNHRNIDSQQLTNQIKTLQEELVNQENVKFGTFQFGAKKAAAKKLEQTQQNIITAKKQLEIISQNYHTEQDKLHEKQLSKKQELSIKSETLHKKIEQTEIDNSIEARRKTCTNLNNAINELIKRSSSTTNSSN
jgi:hypothetical protein